MLFILLPSTMQSSPSSRTYTLPSITLMEEYSPSGKSVRTVLMSVTERSPPTIE